MRVLKIRFLFYYIIITAVKTQIQYIINNMIYNCFRYCRQRIMHFKHLKCVHGTRLASMSILLG